MTESFFIFYTLVILHCDVDIKIPWFWTSGFWLKNCKDFRKIIKKNNENKDYFQKIRKEYGSKENKDLVDTLKIVILKKFSLNNTNASIITS